MPILLYALLHALWAALLVLLALGHDGGTKTAAEVFREFVQLGIAINLDGLLGGIADHIAVMAPRKMIFQFGLRAVVDDAVEIVG
jgi:hypothetical protein